jgi:hypothetical protein
MQTKKLCATVTIIDYFSYYVNKEDGIALGNIALARRDDMSNFECHDRTNDCTLLFFSKQESIV